MIGATIRKGAEGATLALSGHTWDLRQLDRGHLTDMARILSDAMGLKPKTPRKSRRNGKD